MAIRWVEGFENDFEDTDFDRKYDNYAAPATNWTSDDGRRDPNGRSVGNTDNSAELVTPVLVTSPAASWTMGFGFKGPGNLSVTEHAGGITFVLNGSGDQLEFRWNSINDRVMQLRVYRGATLLGSTEGIFTQQWYYIEIKCTIDNTAGSWEVRADGTVIGSGSGQDTQNQAGSGADQVAIHFRIQNGAALHDDIYIKDDSTYLGDSLVEGLRPDGDGNRTEWTPSSGTSHYVLVDDPAGSPNDTDRVTSDTVGHDDLYTFADSALTDSNSTIHAVMVQSSAGMEASGTRDLRHRHRDSGGSEDVGATFSVVGTAFDHYFDVFETNPALDVAWSNTNLNASEFGVEVVA